MNERNIATNRKARHNYNHDPRRKRKLLLHRKEIWKLWDQTRQQNLAIIPLRIYLKKGRAKIEIALAKGKKLYDKRRTLAKRDAQREIERQLAKKR